MAKLFDVVLSNLQWILEESFGEKEKKNFLNANCQKR